jgi:hypothetical protein
MAWEVCCTSGKLDKIGWFRERVGRRGRLAGHVDESRVYMKD